MSWPVQGPKAKRGKNQNSIFPLQGSRRNDVPVNNCLVVLERQIFLGAMELIGNGLLSGQNCFSATWLLPRISLGARTLTVTSQPGDTAWHAPSTGTTHQISGMCAAALFQRTKRTKSWERGNLLLATVSAFQWSLDLRWIWLGLHRGIW